MNILIVKLSAIGDVLHTLPALNALKKQYPDAKITWIVEEAAASLIMGHEALDRVLVSKRKRWVKDLKTRRCRQSLKEASAFIKALRDTHYDLIIDFHALLKSGMLIWLAHGDMKMGFDKGMEHMEHSYIFLNKRVPPVAMDTHAMIRSLMLLDALDIHTREIIYKLPVSKKDHLRVDSLLMESQIDSDKVLIPINPVAKWDTKLWPNAKFAELADRLTDQHNAAIVFTGADDDIPIIEDIMFGMKNSSVNMAGRTSLLELAALYQKAKLVVSTDTGPMHLAAAVETPVVAIFGPTAPWRTGPYGPSHQVIRRDLECSPCFKRQCRLDTTACMNEISVDQVLDGCLKLL
ncbi:MAG: lipopolysaccharide heptosyltransferase I [Desulfobacterales bacterium]|nr:lipopolysaccharide heptosyltransferase I [Desulfobacterales bacterium]